MPQVAVQLIVYRSSKTLPTVLAYLKKQIFKDLILFVQDNSCEILENEKTKSILDQSGIRYQLTLAEKNIGFTAHNELFKKHDASYTFLLNDDALLMPDYLEKLVYLMEEKKDCASASGLVLRIPEITDQEIVRPSQDMIDTAGLDYKCLARITDRFAGCYVRNKRQELKETQKVFGVSACAALYRSKAVKEVSPDDTFFDSSFFMYKEDAELAVRLKRKNFSSHLVPGAIALHARSIKSEKYGLRERIKEERSRNVRLRICSYRNQWMIYIYHFSFKLGFKDIALSFFYEKGRSILALVSSPSVFLKSWAWILSSLSAALKKRRELKKLGLVSRKLI